MNAPGRANGVPTPNPELIYLIPGQGGDPRGALHGLYEAANAEPWIRAAIDEVFAEVEPVGAAHGLGPVGEVLLRTERPGQPGHAEQPGRPGHAERRAPMPPGMAPLAAYTASIALHRVLADADVRPERVIGQSFGEIATLVCAGAFTVAEGATAVCALSEAFRIAQGRGGMVLVRASQADTEKILAGLMRPELVVACVDAPDETIVSGPNDAVDALLALRNRDGGEFGDSEFSDGGDLPPLVRLAVPYASHHPDLRPVAERFRAGLQPLRQRPLACEVLSPVRRRAYADTDDLRDALADCVIKPVHLIESFETLPRAAHDSTPFFIEIGVGASLCRCARATLPGARTLAPLSNPLRARELLRPLIP